MAGMVLTCSSPLPFPASRAPFREMHQFQHFLQFVHVLQLELGFVTGDSETMRHNFISYDKTTALVVTRVSLHRPRLANTKNGIRRTVRRQTWPSYTMPWFRVRLARPHACLESTRTRPPPNTQLGASGTDPGIRKDEKAQLKSAEHHGSTPLSHWGRCISCKTGPIQDLRQSPAAHYRRPYEVPQTARNKIHQDVTRHLCNPNPRLLLSTLEPIEPLQVPKILMSPIAACAHRKPQIRLTKTRLRPVKGRDPGVTSSTVELPRNHECASFGARWRTVRCYIYPVACHSERPAGRPILGTGRRGGGCSIKNPAGWGYANRRTLSIPSSPYEYHVRHS
ncbi:uncharacterized protein CLUP02_10291 [Colletotrichum lupini]|uniref:Uncharacterized protein n=1 Tax=Colletotrichum lupini TaxID=145971 RepID=A0A9Q8SWM0_9PEZI|nr:uncharacterized protein CLUP02_10291 [Colletotrichum lupini]UQC84795.1 hypothetical protein CLUP02_10291 [Colletotrichum lupini]